VLFYALCLIVVPLPPGINPFKVNNNNNNNNNNNLAPMLRMFGAILQLPQHSSTE
jgi:hypothetical protein